MRDVQNIFCFLLVIFLVVILSRPAYSIHVNTLLSTDALTISSNRTIVSPGDFFELGFFKAASRTRWYLGIWYKKISVRTYVWVANRDKPLSNSTGTFKISDTNLVLLDHSNNIVWSTNLSKRYVRSPVVAELLANGNLVVKYSNNKNDPSGYLWQSFDYPTDTLLPEMKLGLDRKTGVNSFLKSWSRRDYPASGKYSFKLETRGIPEFFVLYRDIPDIPVSRTGPWNGVRFSGFPEIPELNYMVNNFTNNKEETAYTFLMTNHNIYSRLTLSFTGLLELSTWSPTLRGWKIWASPTERCDFYQLCGPYGYCDALNEPVCKCIKGFKPKDPETWKSELYSQGCVRKTRLSCGGDEFLRLTKMKLPETRTATLENINGIKECAKRCTYDCNCTAFASADIRNGGSGCVIWTGELTDMRNYAKGGQDLYVRLASADLGVANTY